MHECKVIPDYSSMQGSSHTYLPLCQRPVGLLLVHKNHVLQHSLAHAHQLWHNTVCKQDEGRTETGQERSSIQMVQTAAACPSAPSCTFLPLLCDGSTAYTTAARTHRSMSAQR